MPMTRKFRDTVWTRAQSDARFRTAMLTEAINELLAGDLDTGKAHAARLRQRQHYLRRLGESDTPPHQKSAAHARATRQPDGGESLRHLQGVAEVRAHPACRHP